MKKIIFFLMLLMAAPAMEALANPWHQRTRHKPIKKMTRKQVRQAQVGYTLYERNPRTGKVEKTTNRQWSTAKKPTTYNAFHNKSKGKR